MGRLWDMLHPQSYRTSGCDVERESVTLDSNGDADVTVNFDDSITYTSNQEWGFWLSKRGALFDWYYDNVGASSVDIHIRDGPASTEVTFEVMRVANRYNDLSL